MSLGAGSYIVLACLAATGVWFTFLTKVQVDSMEALRAALAALATAVTGVESKVTELKAASVSAITPGDLAAVTQSVQDAAAKLASITAS